MDDDGENPPTGRGNEYSLLYKVRRIGFFGSYVRSDTHRGSDPDVHVESFDTIRLHQLVSLENNLTALTGIRVDLIPRGISAGR
ncbi:MAG TPA: nucleotidyltransferase domain-containing protein [Methanoregula sp.]|nr:nucleotidyltransferase domain-containing protein [Methanoregula sp.]